MPTKTEAIKNWLTHATHKNLSSLYSHDMEVQVNVARDGGERITGEYKGKKWSGWTDGEQTWKNFRVPWNAWKDPQYVDKEIMFSLEHHAEGVGMTGWNWKNRTSIWVTYDVDSLVGHSTGLTAQQMNSIREACVNLPWVQVRTSTGGKGIHLYVFFEAAVPTQTHTEHAALARAVLAQMSSETGFEFEASIDVVGGNAWVWHRKMVKSDGGLAIIREATTHIQAPPDWRDHLAVVSRRRSRPIPEGVSEDRFGDLAGAHANLEIDTEHRRLLDWLENSPSYYYFQAANNMLVTHTFHLKEAHEALGLKGQFETLSTGKEYGQDKNCFCFPVPHGGWMVRRFSPGCTEHPLWTIDESGWTRILYNSRKAIDDAADESGLLATRKGVYVADNFSQLTKFEAQIGVELGLPQDFMDRDATVRQEGNTITIETNHIPGDEANPPPDGWRYDRRKWKKTVKVESPSEAREVGQFQFLQQVDPHLRYTNRGSDKSKEGVWYCKDITEQWRSIRAPYLYNFVRAKWENALVDTAIAACLGNPWQIVHHPFQEEYPGHREWNFQPVTFSVPPAEWSEDLQFPTWAKLLAHIGSSIDDDLQDNQWAVNNSITTGEEYLTLWIASLFQYPKSPLPYLFLCGPEQGGKSLFHEAIATLMTDNGVKEAENALTSQGSFNEELESCVLAYVEEIDLSGHKSLAAQRIKKWVTSLTLLMNPKHRSTYVADNLTHWIQCANPISYCPVFQGDTRITVIWVNGIPEIDQIPKHIFLEKLREEASYFLAHLLHKTIPSCRDRLRIPALESADKTMIQEQHQSPTDIFIAENCEIDNGAVIPLPEFAQKFRDEYRADMSDISILRKIPNFVVKGRIGVLNRAGKEQRTFLGNIRWKEGEPCFPYGHGRLSRLGRYLMPYEEKECQQPTSPSDTTVALEKTPSPAPSSQSFPTTISQQDVSDLLTP